MCLFNAHQRAHLQHFWLQTLLAVGNLVGRGSEKEGKHQFISLLFFFFGGQLLLRKRHLYSAPHNKLNITQDLLYHGDGTVSVDGKPGVSKHAFTIWPCIRRAREVINLEALGNRRPASILRSRAHSATAAEGQI